MLQPPRMIALALFAAALSVPLVTSAPAAAASCTPEAYAASASADVARLSLVNLDALSAAAPSRLAALRAGPLADLTIGATTSSMDARRPVAVRASAAYLSTGSAARVAQQAPPVSTGPAEATGTAVDLGAVRVGTGPLSARAAWQPGMACGNAGGPAGAASASVADLSILSLVKARNNVRSQAVTGLRTVGGRMASTAAAELELADLSLLGGAVSVKVLKPPTLTVTATGVGSTSTATYQAPLLEVSGAGLAPKRLSTPSQQIELAVPVPGLTQTLAAAKNLPLLPGNPLGSLLGDLPAARTPSLGILRLSLGAGKSSISDAGVRASASSLRIQLLIAGASAAKSSAVLDLGIGVLSASATAPCPPSASPPPPPPPSAGCGGPQCPGLPVTGMPPVAYATGAGVLLLILGRFLLLLSRRRAEL